MARPVFTGHEDGSVTVRLPEWLRRLLVEQSGELDRLLAGGDPATGPPDPLEAITGLTSGDGRRPDDPVLLRLRPDGYRASDDPAAAREFRRFTEADLAGLQRARLATVRETALGGDRVRLDPGQAQSWLGAINDLRLALGTRLDVTEDPADEPGPDDPLAGAFELYHLLGALQHQLLVALGAPDAF